MWRSTKLELSDGAPRSSLGPAGDRGNNSGRLSFSKLISPSPSSETAEDLEKNQTWAKTSSPVTRQERAMGLLLLLMIKFQNKSRGMGGGAGILIDCNFHGTSLKMGSHSLIWQQSRIGYQQISVMMTYRIY